MDMSSEGVVIGSAERSEGWEREGREWQLERTGGCSSAAMEHRTEDDEPGELALPAVKRLMLRSTLLCAALLSERGRGRSGP